MTETHTIDLGWQHCLELMRQDASRELDRPSADTLCSLLTVCRVDDD